jgi:Resolvase, N terminal domain
MRVAVYARVSTTRQAQAQTIQQQLDRLRAAVAERGWRLEEQHVDRDDGYSGASLGRLGLDRLRDHAALAELDLVVVTAPDRLARNYVHQVLLLDELGRPRLEGGVLGPSHEPRPHDRLLLGDPRGGRRVGAHADRRADAPRAAGQAAGGHAAWGGPRRRSATAWTPSGPARRPRCGSRSCSTGTCSRGRPCTGSPSG